MLFPYRQVYPRSQILVVRECGEFEIRERVAVMKFNQSASAFIQAVITLQLLCHNYIDFHVYLLPFLFTRSCIS